jgi:hypothetical protein
MTTSEIITIIVSSLALVVSGLTAYLTLLARFQGNVLPRHRAILAPIEGTPCLILECEFVNPGAKSGSIEDLLVNTYDDQGNRFVFTPFLTKEQFNVYDKYQINDFSIFSGISLGAKQRQKIFIVFRPSQTDFKANPGAMYLQTNISSNISHKKWSRSPVTFSLNLKAENIQEWASASGKYQQIPAMEIGQSRTAFLNKKRK